MTTTKSRETKLKVSDWIFSLSKKGTGEPSLFGFNRGKSFFFAECRQMKTACQCCLWAVQNARHTELSWLVWSLFAGSTAHIFAFGCGCDFSRKVHQCWTCKATVQICFPPGCKCIDCPFCCGGVTPHTCTQKSVECDLTFSSVATGDWDVEAHFLNNWD